MAKGLLWLNGVVFLLFGLVCIAAPEFPTGLSGIELAGGDAPIEIRAQYGGIFLAIGIFGLLGALKPAFEPSALMMLLLVYAGLASGRLVGLVMDPGPIGNYTYSALSFEIVFTILFAITLMRASPVPEPA